MLSYSACAADPRDAPHLENIGTFYLPRGDLTLDATNTTTSSVSGG